MKIIAFVTSNALARNIMIFTKFFILDLPDHLDAQRQSSGGRDEVGDPPIAERHVDNSAVGAPHAESAKFDSLELKRIASDSHFPVTPCWATFSPLNVH